MSKQEDLGWDPMKWDGDTPQLPLQNILPVRVSATTTSTKHITCKGFTWGGKLLIYVQVD